MVKLDVLISDKYKFVYIGIPKVATRSFITSLYREPKHDYECKHNMIRLDIIEKMVDLSQYFVFTFVRNPWARIVSCYLNKIQNPSQDAIDIIISKYDGIYPNMKWPDFVDFLVHHPNGGDILGDPHWISQHRLLKTTKQIENINIFKLEEIQDALPEISQKLQMPTIEMEFLNTYKGWKNSQNHNSQHSDAYKELYDSITLEKITQRYLEDITRFNYQF